MQKHLVKNPQRYDIICSFQVLEHVTEVGEFIDACLKCLKPGGLLIYAVPNNNPFLYKHDKFNVLNLPPHHAGLWNKISLLNIEKFFDLTVINYKVEPIDNLKHQIKIILTYKGFNRMVHIIKRIPYKLFNFMLTV